MTRHIACITALVIAGVPVQGQFKIALPALDSCHLPTGTYIERVFLATPPAIGTVHRGPMNEEVVAFLEPSTEAAFLQVVQGACSSRSEGQAIAIKVNHLRITERVTGTAEFAFAYINIDVLVRSGDQWRLAYNAGTQHGGKGGMDATGNHAENIKHALQDCLLAFSSAWANGGLMDHPLDEAQLTERTRIELLDLPILRTQTIPRGVFRDLMAFRECRLEPLAEGAIEFASSGQVRVPSATKDMRSGIWGLSDGTYCYARQGKKFIRLNQDNAGFTAVLRRSEMDAEDQATMGVMFGLIGALAVSGQEEYVARLDLLTGEFKPEHSPASAETVVHVVQYSRYSKSSDTLSVVCRGKTYVLDKGGHCEIRTTPDLEPLTATVRAPGGGTLTLWLPCHDKGTFASLVELKRDGIPSEMKLNAMMENSILEELQPERRRPPEE